MSTGRPTTAWGRWQAEVATLARRSLIELIGAGVLSLLLVREHGTGVVLASTVALWGGWYLISCWLWPLRNCWRCDGTGQPRVGDGAGSWRDKLCRRCAGGKEVRRWGALVLGRGAPDRHDELKERLTQ